MLSGTKIPTGAGETLVLSIGICFGKIWIGYLWTIFGLISIICLPVSRGVYSASIEYFYDDFDFLLNVSNLTIVSLFSINFSFIVFFKFLALESICPAKLGEFDFALVLPWVKVFLFNQN